MANNVVVPFDRKARVEASLRPADITEAEEVVAWLAKALPVMPSIQDPPAFKAIMAERLARYPSDVLLAAVDQARDDFKEMPSTRQMVEICERLIEPRQAELRAIQRAEDERRAREQEAVERAAEAEREAKHEAERERRRQATVKRLRHVEERARERLGDDAPLPGDLELADSLTPTQLYRLGKPVSWLTALADGEHWAAKYCRQMALAKRIKRALEQGHVSWDEALAVVKLIVIDEESARRRIEDMQDRPAKYPGDQPTESFWRAVWRIVRASGLDAPVFPEDAAAAAVDNLKHLAGLAALADHRAVIDQQVREAWAARRAKRAKEEQR